MMAEMAQYQNQQSNRGNNLSLSRRTPLIDPLPCSERDAEIRETRKVNDINRSNSGLSLNTSREKQGIITTNNGNYGQLQ